MSFFGSIGSGFTGIFEEPIKFVAKEAVRVAEFVEPELKVVEKQVGTIVGKGGAGVRKLIGSDPATFTPKRLLEKSKDQIIKLDPRESDGTFNTDLAPFKTLKGLQQRISKIKPKGVKNFLKRHKNKVKNLAEEEQKVFIDFVSKL